MGNLGTSNTVVAYAAPGKQQVELFEIEQLVAPGQVAARPLLPSVRYHPAAGEISPGDLQLPWTSADGSEPVLTGRLALDLGAQVPGRLVASAKSWLSHALVDRMAPILPWGAEEDVAKVSPVGGQRQLSGACARRLVAPLSEIAAGTAAGHPDRSRLLRRRRAGADAGSGATGGFAESAAA